MNKTIETKTGVLIIAIFTLAVSFIAYGNVKNFYQDIQKLIENSKNAELIEMIENSKHFNSNNNQKN